MDEFHRHPALYDLVAHRDPGRPAGGRERPGHRRRRHYECWAQPLSARADQVTRHLGQEGVRRRGGTRQALLYPPEGRFPPGKTQSIDDVHSNGQ